MQVAFYERLKLRSEEDLVRRFVIASIVIHIFVLLFHTIMSFNAKTPEAEEWSMAADLLPDVEISAPKKSALPDAKPAEEAAVPKNMLPQLAKQTSIQETQVEKPKDDSMIDPDSKAKPTPEAQKTPQAVVVVKPIDDGQNKLKLDEALKRLALEKLREDQKTSDRVKAPEKDALARIKDEIAANKNINAGVTGAGATDHNKYIGQLVQAIRRNYALPEAYNLKDSNLSVTVAITLNDRGDLVAIDVRKNSGDPVFDDLTVKAIKDSVPLPKPPEDQVGHEMLVNFSPKRM